MAVSKRLRYEILRRDNHTCRYCGGTAPDVKLTVDHVVPVALGGTDDAVNLVAACSACNGGKAASNPDAPLVADVAQAALKWQVAMRLAADLNLRDRERTDPMVKEVIDYWLEQWAWMESADRPYPDADGRQVVREWVARGLTPAEMCDFIDRTVGKWTRDRYLKTDDTWRYFAGCCWKRLTEIEEQARSLIDREEV